MNLPRRRLLALAASAAAVPTLPRATRAQNYPARPVHFIVGFAAGGAPDIIGRLLGQWLSDRLGQPFVIENRPGADSNIAAEAVTRAAPDGYTLFEVTVANCINTSLHSAVDPMRDLAPIASVASAPFVLAVNPSFPARTVPELIAYAKANPGQLTVGSPSTGTPPYLSATLFRMMAGIEFLQVPYRNSLQAVSELLAGRQDVVVSDMSAIEFVKAGKLNALAVTTATRQGALPDTPTIGGYLPGYVATTWYGLGAAKDTPPDIIAQLNDATNAALADPKNQTRLADLGFTPTARSPSEFGAYIAAETEKWGKVIRDANIKPQ